MIQINKYMVCPMCINGSLDIMLDDKRKTITMICLDCKWHWRSSFKPKVKK